MDIILVGREVSCFMIYPENGYQIYFDPVPDQLRLKTAPENPALPFRRTSEAPPQSPYITVTRGTGSKRIYLDIQSSPENSAYPPRPVPGSVADLDIVMDHCDFSEKKVNTLCTLFILVLLMLYSLFGIVWRCLE